MLFPICCFCLMEFFVVVQCLQLAFIHIYRIVQFLLAKILFYYLSFSLRFLLCLQFACFYVKYALEAISLVYEMQFSMSPMLPPKCFFLFCKFGWLHLRSMRWDFFLLSLPMSPIQLHFECEC